MYFVTLFISGTYAKWHGLFNERSNGAILRIRWKYLLPYGAATINELLVRVGNIIYLFST